MLEITLSSGKLFFGGDIHGEKDCLFSALDKAGFNFDTDKFICTGDIVDKGPQSLECLKLLREFWFYSVLGNHEIQLIQAIKDYQAEGVDGLCKPIHTHWAAKCGGGWFFDENVIKSCIEYLPFLEDLPLQIQVTDKAGVRFGVTHGAYNIAAWSNHRKTEYNYNSLVWERVPLSQYEKMTSPVKKRKLHNKSKVAGLTAVIHGHTPVNTPTVIGNHIYLDADTDKTGKYFVMSSEEIVESITAKEA